MGQAPCRPHYRLTPRIDFLKLLRRNNGSGLVSERKNKAKTES